MTNLRTAKFKMEFWKTIVNIEDQAIDMYLLIDDDDGEGIVSFAVPHGRSDIASFLYRSCIAGQRVLNEVEIDNIEDFKP